ncbi:MAG TPA: LptF/LptG family permease [Candidatus Omnitrophota bacterium]|nr:LptF/LptG family permease [Candidatus Omnitrophota bacterium]
MKILRTYILRETFIPFLLALCVLTCVFLLGNLVKLTDMVINKGVGLSTIGKIFILYVPMLLGYTLPIASLIAVITTFSQLSSDNEILAMRACGIHLGRLLFPLFIVGIILSLTLIILNERLIPYAHYQQRNILKNLGKDNPTAFLEPGVFIDAFGDQILFIHRIQGNKMYNVTIYQPQANRPTRTIVAKEGEFTPVPGEDQIKLKLIDGTSDEPDLTNPENFYKLNFRTYFMTLDFTKEKITAHKKPKSMSLDELSQEIERLQSLFIDPGSLVTEYWRKIASSFSPLFFILLGFPLAVVTNRREKSANIMLAMIFAVGYYVITMGCEGLSTEKIFPAQYIMWAPNLLAALVAGALYTKCVS